MPVFGCRTGRKGRETHGCTHIPVLGQPVVPAHELSGRINTGEVLPWDPQDPVIFSTVTLRREQRRSEVSLHAGFETKTQISHLLLGTLHGCQPFPRVGIPNGGVKHSLSTGASSTPPPWAPEPNLTSLGQGSARQTEERTGGTNPCQAEVGIGHHREEVPQALPFAAGFQRAAFDAMH